MSKAPQSPGVREQLGIIIGLGCHECEGYITVDYIEERGNQAVCSNCGHEYWVPFNEDALRENAPKLLAACVSLLGVVMRAPGSGDDIAQGTPGYTFIKEALTAVALATNYPADFWEDLSTRMSQALGEPADES